jgi:hypothetical protein
VADACFLPKLETQILNTACTIFTHLDIEAAEIPIRPPF